MSCTSEAQLQAAEHFKYFILCYMVYHEPPWRLFFLFIYLFLPSITGRLYLEGQLHQQWDPSGVPLQAHLRVLPQHSVTAKTTAQLQKKSQVSVASGVPLPAPNT